MHRHEHFSDHAEHVFWHMAGRMGGRGPHGHSPFGQGMRGGRGGPGDFFRAGRMLADGDLKLIVLYLLEGAPRHGYDIIKALEELSSGFYSPSPGVVYPTLTFLDEAGYAASATEGNKKVFSITDAGREHLEDKRDFVEHAVAHLERFGAKMARAREWFGWNEDDEFGRDRRSKQHRAFHVMRRRLRVALAEFVDASAEKQAEALRILESAVNELEALSRR